MAFIYHSRQVVTVGGLLSRQVIPSDLLCGVRKNTELEGSCLNLRLGSKLKKDGLQVQIELASEGR